MKILYCDECMEGICLRFDLQACRCGNVEGRYLPNGSLAAVHARNRDKARLVGIPNELLRGDVREASGFVISWLDRHVRYCRIYRSGDIEYVRLGDMIKAEAVALANQRSPSTSPTSGLPDDAVLWKDYEKFRLSLGEIRLMPEIKKD